MVAGVFGSHVVTVFSLVGPSAVTM